MGKSIKQCHRKREEEKAAFNKALLGAYISEPGLDESDGRDAAGEGHL